jgi:type IV secretory pathway VirB3-like protein
MGSMKLPLQRLSKIFGIVRGCAVFVGVLLVTVFLTVVMLLALVTLGRIF